MDNSLDERMAPALHTSEHERVESTIKKSYQIIDSSSGLDKKNGLNFNRIDGPFSNTLLDNNHHDKKFDFKHNSVDKCFVDYNERGPTGDHEITNLKSTPELPNDGSGDFKIPRTNGWSNQEHNMDKVDHLRQLKQSFTQMKSNGTGLHELDINTETDSLPYKIPQGFKLDLNEGSKTISVKSTIPTDSHSAATIGKLINSISPSIPCSVVSSKTSIIMSSSLENSLDALSNLNVDHFVSNSSIPSNIKNENSEDLEPNHNNLNNLLLNNRNINNFSSDSIGAGDSIVSFPSYKANIDPTAITPAHFPSQKADDFVSDQVTESSVNLLNNVANTTLTFNTTSPISSHCEGNSDQNGKTFPLDAKCLNVPGFIDLAQGLVAGGHMQNLSTNLTNTLQELAASLKSQAAAIENEAKPLEKSPSPEKVIKYNCTISNLNHVEEQQKLQLKELVLQDAKLSFQVSELQKRLNKVRNTALTCHVKNEFTKIAANCQTQLSNESFSRNRTFWRSVVSRKSNNKKLFSKRMHKKEETMCLNKASYKTGVLKKELCYLGSQVDEDLTDISSDEECVHFVYTSGTRYPTVVEPISTKQELEKNKSSSKSQSIDESAAWNWACNRAEVAKRWTWLQAQVSELEFKIRHHSDLYKQIRTSKDKVVLGNVEGASNTENNETMHTESEQTSPLTSSSNSPQTSVKQLVKNVEKQTSSFLDTFSPLSGTPSPVPKPNNSSPTSVESPPAAMSDPLFVVPSSLSLSAARCRPLRYSLRRRRLVRLSDLPYQPKKPTTVPNNSSIMKSQCNQQTPFTRRDGRHIDNLQSMCDTKAATHDHSYHRVLSFDDDVSLSVRMNSFMGVNTKWCKEHSSRRNRISESKFRSKKKELKRKLAKAEKLMRSVSALQRNSSVDSTSSEKRKRRQSTHTGESSKRSRMMSVDSDFETSALNRSGSSDMLNNSGNGYTNYQAMLKRRRQADQAYDINNIVIPHGLTATRIEKLQYKEILTPGWRTNEEESTKNKAIQSLPDHVLEEQKNMTDVEYQKRHDNYEVMEKKKYVAYIQWTMNKKNGTRSLGRANLPPQVDAMLASTASSPSFLSPSSPSSPDPSSASGRTRRSSSDQYNFHVHSSVSDVSSVSRDHSTRSRERLSSEPIPCISWERRSFPLNDAAYVDLMKEPVLEAPKPVSKFHSLPTHDTNTAPKYKNFQPADNRTYTIVSRSLDDDHYSDGSTTSSTSRRKSAATTRTSSPVMSSSSRRHKPSAAKDDFYYYSDLGSEGDSATSSAYSDGAVVSDDDHRASGKTFNHNDRWTAKTLTSESYGKSNDLQSNVVRPLLLKIKKR